MDIDTAKLRELAEAVLNTQGADHACLAYHQHLTGMHPADVLALLDENARLREALRFVQPRLDALPDALRLGTERIVSAALSGGAA